MIERMTGNIYEYEIETGVGNVIISTEIEELGGGNLYECQECGYEYNYDDYIETNGCCDDCGLGLVSVGNGSHHDKVLY